ncbi:MAG: DUF4091 domain-containing protein [Clostridia bacterium]|nr:DUF4091 domain-containing protein [Clostridia bacterium]
MKHTRKTRWLPLILVLATLLALLLVACNEGGTEDTTPEETVATTPVTGDSTAEPDVTEAPTGDVTEEATEIPTEEITTEEVTTEDPATRVNEPTDPAHVTFFDGKRPKLNAVISSPNQCKAEVIMDPTYGSVLKLTTTQNASDPFVTFNYANYMKSMKLGSLSADEYKYIVMTIRAENCSSETFELFYYSGTVQGATPGYQTTATFNAGSEDWQKIIFDLSNADWKGNINGFRMDFLTTPGGEGESVYIYAVDFYKTAEEAYGDMDIDFSKPGEGSDLSEKPVEGVNYDKLTAPDEDASVKLWFDHMTEKLYQNNVTATDLNTYVIHMAGNSIENCQFFLAPQADRSFTLSLSDFTDGSGHTLKAMLLREHYVGVNGQMLPDALPPVDGAVTVKGGQSQGFVVKVWAETDQPAGLYSATLNVTDANSGKVVKTATVHVLVYGFSLSEETALRTAINMGDWAIVSTYQNRGMNDYEYWDLYKIYYDFLLENRICAYRMPYRLDDGRVVDYLNNPRVNSFVINKISDNEAQAYEILSQNETWLKKGFYYYVDEPTNTGLLNNLAAAGNRLAQSFPGYRQISPFFTNMNLEDGDQIEFMKNYVNIWCTKPFAFTPRDKAIIAGTQFMTSAAQDAKYGTFAERMAALAREGHETWLYVCWEPGQPYANWLALGDGTEPLVSIWQCKMTDSVGMLYWDSTYWTSDPMNDLTPLIGASSHGDGVLMYSGALIGSYEPISSHRLENIRNGIQDYQLLTMLEELVGPEAADEMVAMVTTDVVTYTSDDDYLKAVRVMLFEKVAEAMK